MIMFKALMMSSNTDLGSFEVLPTVDIRKVAMFTDIHWGKRNNSHIHNNDCLEFVQFFCEQVKADKEIDAVMFLGDWFENRNAVNISTLNYSHRGLDALNKLGKPIYFCVGNHDLYHRHHRDIHSAVMFGQYSNITLIDHPKVMGDFLLCPYLFGAEYGELLHYNKMKYFAGHFEFKNFIMTGNSRLEHGPEHTNYDGVTYIFSGHFHKRQASDNVIYIGNTFPTDYGDSGDPERGMCVLDTRDDDIQFINWEQCPMFMRTTLSKVLDGEFAPTPKTRVKCMLDVEISYSEAQALKQGMIEEFNLREFALEENLIEKKLAISEGGSEAEIDDLELSSIDEMVTNLLMTVNSTTTIDATKLVKIFRDL